MWFGFREENTWYPLNVSRVNEILRLNREGKKPATLDKDQEEEKATVQVLNSDLQRMDQKYRNKNKKKKKKRKGPGDRPKGPADRPNDKRTGNNPNHNKPRNKG
jgi:hypothetical protein